MQAFMRFFIIVLSTGFIVKYTWEYRMLEIAVNLLSRATKIGAVFLNAIICACNFSTSFADLSRWPAFSEQTGVSCNRLNKNTI